MQMHFTNPAQRWAFLSGVFLVAAALGFLAGKDALAEHYARSANAEEWLRAARLEPGNASHWARLARYRHLDLERADVPQAIRYYHRALAIDPRAAYTWTDLAGAYELAGDLPRAREAFETAEAAYPISAEVAWRYGNFLLRQEQFPQAFTEIRRAVKTDPRLAKLAISRCWRATRDIHLILERALPPDAEVYQAALDYLVSEHETGAALVAWQRLLALGHAVELPRAFPLLDELIQSDRIEEARQVWKQAFAAAGLSAGEPSGGSLVWDGGFEGPFTNGGFGWRQYNIAGASFDFATETHHSGARSLRVTFDGSANLDFQHLVQFVPVEPNKRYRFAAHLRTDAITTDSGVRFAIFPHGPGERPVLTPNLMDTQPWALDETEFTTGPQTRLVEIVLRRMPSQKLDNKIQGTVWVDDVSLTPLAPAAARRAP